MLYSLASETNSLGLVAYVKYLFSIMFDQVSAVCCC